MAPDKLRSGLKSILFGHSFKYFELFFRKERIVSIHVWIGIKLSQTCHYHHPKLFKVQIMYIGFNFQQWSEF